MSSGFIFELRIGEDKEEKKSITKFVEVIFERTINRMVNF